MDKKDWQPRQVMNKSDYEIFYYFNKGQKEVPSHKHDFYEIMTILSGSATFWIDGTAHSANGGDILITPPNKNHNMTINSAYPYERIILWISKSFIQSMSTFNTDLSYAFSAASQENQNLLSLPPVDFQHILEMQSTIGRFAESKEYADDLLAKIALMQLLLKINKIFFNKNESNHNATFIQSLLEYINSNFTEDLNLERLSSRFFLSQSRISHIFKQEMGTSLHKYVIKKRLMRSKELIEKGYPINKVCFMSGFKDYIGFFKPFKAEFNMTPKEYYSEFVKQQKSTKPKVLSTSVQNDAPPPAGK